MNQEKKYILKKIISKKSLKDQISTPSLPQTDYQCTSSSGLRDSCTDLEKKISQLQATNQKLKQQISRMKYIEQQLSECKRQIQQLLIQKDFYMRAYKTIKRQSSQLYKQSMIRQKSLKHSRRQSQDKPSNIYQFGQSLLSPNSQPLLQSPRFPKSPPQQPSTFLPNRQKISSLTKSKLFHSLSSNKLNKQQLSQNKLISSNKYFPTTQSHPYGFISKSKQKAKRQKYYKLKN